MHHGARKIIGETMDDFGSRRRVAAQKRLDFGDIFVCRAGFAWPLIEEHDAHDRSPPDGFQPVRPLFTGPIILPQRRVSGNADRIPVAAINLYVTRRIDAPSIQSLRRRRTNE